ncbi:MAG: bile acid:sodium symporter family protein [Planctomycetaceae bacterium]|jgi:bile acid:Na+ symporter, BASS family|nr:bile acid:sodium symporter family protein [Planctomycetaceae bacterium]MBT6155894.1 bile acid:sodium symporter family protein [Planctomycetaceae bacterium]MBT6485317.1 bile acid:sodium symporter family protein [Planctomycetaceae bacterium]
MLQRFLLLWLILSSLLAYSWPRVWGGIVDGSGVTLDPTFDLFQVVYDAGALKPIIRVTMFCIGCLLPRDEIAQVFRKWPTVFGGTAVQYAAMPALAFLVCLVLQLDEATRIGVIFVGCVPGAMASNVLTLAAKGNVSYSVSLTTAATLLSPLTVPIALWVTLGSSVALDPLKVSLDLLTLVVGPVVAGHLICRYFKQIEALMRIIAPAAANLTILAIIAVIVGVNRGRLGNVTPYVLVGLLIVNLLGYVAGYCGGRLLRLPEAMRRALTLEVGMQNAGLGTVLVIEMFPKYPEAAIPTAAYTFGCMLTGTMLAHFWSRKPTASMEASDAT